MGHLLKPRAAEQPPAQDARGPEAPTQEPLSPGVDALLNPRRNGSESGTHLEGQRASVHAHWPKIKWLLWGSDFLLVALSSLLLVQSPWPPYLTATLCLIGFAAAALLGIIALVGDKFL